MKYFNRIFIAVVGMMTFLIIGTNHVLLHLSEDIKTGREHRVEINRLVGNIEKNGLESIDLSKCQYVTNVTKDISKTDAAKQDFIMAGESEYLILRIGDSYYRFEYETAIERCSPPIIVIVNFVFAVLFLLVIAIMMFVKRKILSPFFLLRDVPIELSKGNLTIPLKENKSRFFSRFVWGMDLLRENLEQHKQKELALQKEKRIMVLSISHDIKTPLSAIKLYAKVLSKGLYPDKEKQLEIAENINRKADEIEQYVSDIIKAEKEDFLELPVNNGEFYLSQLLRSVEEFYKDKLTYLNTDFYMADYSDCLLYGDVERGIEVLQNIMENAIKYGNGSYIKIENEQEEDCQLIMIKNSGCTLNEAEEPHIFDAFWRGQNANRVTGNGLGLYICKKLMHKMDGEIFSKIKEETICIIVVFRMVS